MPSSPGYVRDYKREYKVSQSSKKAKQQRARNNKANRDAGTYGNKDGKDVAHSKAGARGRVLGLQSPAKNRSFPRNKNAQRKK